MPSPDGEPTVGQALALGLLQGPTELLPVSSSAHTTLLPWLAGSSYARLAGPARKSFEVALHVGAAAGLVLAMGEQLTMIGDAPRREGAPRDGWRRSPLGLRRHLELLVVSAAPAALAGTLLRARIERRLQGPGTLAAALLCGGAAMALAELRPASRALASLGTADALALGVAQAAALLPGVSRRGATLAAARCRGFGPEDADALSWAVALPVLLGAGALEAIALARRRRIGPGLRAGALAAFASTCASARLLQGPLRRTRARLLPFAVYRVALGTFVLLRLRVLRGRSQ
jgi:undecaprenyl-diphosphatase